MPRLPVWAVTSSGICLCSECCRLAITQPLAQDDRRYLPQALTQAPVSDYRLPSRQQTNSRALTAGREPFARANTSNCRTPSTLVTDFRRTEARTHRRQTCRVSNCLQFTRQAMNISEHHCVGRSAAAPLASPPCFALPGLLGRGDCFQDILAFCARSLCDLHLA